VQIQSLSTDNAMVAAGGHHSLVLTTAGAVFSFGRGNSGPLGHGDRPDQLSPVQVPRRDGRSRRGRCVY
jgi:alpha-tubulin suppressor-like RCC1 family protein